MSTCGFQACFYGYQSEVIDDQYGGGNHGDSPIFLHLVLCGSHQLLNIILKLGIARTTPHIWKTQMKHFYGKEILDELVNQLVMLS